jgi:serine phosphatase RsbU (regulator of sigma subunit)
MRQKSCGEETNRRAGRPEELTTGQGNVLAGEDGRAEEVRELKEEMAALRREQGKLRQAVFEAAQIQRRICAPREYSRGEFEIAGEIFPVRDLSGDFFKVMELGSELGIVVGDIAGKGLSAGIWLTYLVGLMHCTARELNDPAAVMAKINEELCGGYGEPPMTALFFARLEPEKGSLAYCNAGLPPPLILRGGEVVRLEKGGPMLGATHSAKFSAETVMLEPGDTLMAYSDGVTECRNAQDDEFDLKRLSTAARAASGESAGQTLFSTLGAVLDFAGGCAPGDDLTLLVVRRRERAGAIAAPRREENSVLPGQGQVSVMRPGGLARMSSVS